MEKFRESLDSFSDDKSNNPFLPLITKYGISHKQLSIIIGKKGHVDISSRDYCDINYISSGIAKVLGFKIYKRKMFVSARMKKERDDYMKNVMKMNLIFREDTVFRDEGFIEFEIPPETSPVEVYDTSPLGCISEYFSIESETQSLKKEMKWKYQNDLRFTREKKDKLVYYTTKFTNHKILVKTESSKLDKFIKGLESDDIESPKVVEIKDLDDDSLLESMSISKPKVPLESQKNILKRVDNWLTKKADIKLGRILNKVEDNKDPVNVKFDYWKFTIDIMKKRISSFENIVNLDGTELERFCNIREIVIKNKKNYLIAKKFKIMTDGFIEKANEVSTNFLSCRFPRRNFIRFEKDGSLKKNTPDVGLPYIETVTYLMEESIRLSFSNLFGDYPKKTQICETVNKLDIRAEDDSYYSISAEQVPLYLLKRVGKRRNVSRMISHFDDELEIRKTCTGINLLHKFQGFRGYLFKNMGFGFLANKGLLKLYLINNKSKRKIIS